MNYWFSTKWKTLVTLGISNKELASNYYCPKYILILIRIVTQLEEKNMISCMWKKEIIYFCLDLIFGEIVLFQNLMISSNFRLRALLF